MKKTVASILAALCVLVLLCSSVSAAYNNPNSPQDAICSEQKITDEEISKPASSETSADFLIRPSFGSDLPKTSDSLAKVSSEDCDHVFDRWGNIGGGNHSRRCRICGHTETEPHENSYGGCPKCDFGTFDYSFVNLSDTADMTVDELIKYMGEVFGETNLDFETNKRNSHFTLHRNFMNILASKYSYDSSGVIDRAECLSIDVYNPNALNGYFYVMDGIRICSTYEDIINSSKALGYKVSSRIDSTGNNQVYIDNGKEILAFYYDEDLAKYEPGSANIDRVKVVELYTCRDDFYSGSQHPAHDLSNLTLDNILGMEKEAGISKLCEMFGTDAIDADSNNAVLVNHAYGTEYLDGFSFTVKLKQQRGKYIFSEFDTDFKTDHADKKPKIISELPNVLTVAELDELLNEYGGNASSETCYYDDSYLPNGASCTHYVFTLDDYIVTYSVNNYLTYSDGMQELISEDELPYAKGSIVNVALREKFSPADVNSDGEVTLDDAVLTLKVAMNVDIGGETFIEQAADVVSDGGITLDDAIAVLKIAMNVVS